MITNGDEIKEHPVWTTEGGVESCIELVGLDGEFLELMTSLNGSCDWSNTDIGVPDGVMEVFETVMSVRVNISGSDCMSEHDFSISGSLEPHRSHIKGKIGSVFSSVAYQALNFCRKHKTDTANVRIAVDGRHPELGWGWKKE